MKTLATIILLMLSINISLADKVSELAPDSLNALNDQFNKAAADLDAKALVDLYAEHTLWIEQGKPVSRGLKGPRELFEFVTSNKGKVVHTIDHLFISKDETLAVMIGSVDAEIERVGLDATGTYLFVLRPEDDGWEIVTDMWHQHN